MKVNEVFMGDEMTNAVMQYFLRVSKNHDCYHAFHKSFNNMKKSSSSEKNPFGNFKDIVTFKKNFETFSKRDFERNSRNNDDYERITMMINHLLHFFLEASGIDPRRLGMLGQEIFDLTCYSLYGEKYLNDMEKMNSQTNARAPRNDQEAWLLFQFMEMRKRGMIDKSVTFDDFIRQQIQNGNMPNFDDSDYHDNFNNEIEDGNYYEDDEDDEFDADEDGDEADNNNERNDWWNF